MVNPQVGKEHADNVKRGIPKHLLCAPVALALTAVIPIGAAYADEVVSSVEDDSSSSAIEAVEESSDTTSSEAGSEQGSSAEGASGSTEAGSAADEDEASVFEGASQTTAPVTTSAPKPSTTSSSSDSSDSSDSTVTGDSSDAADTEAVDPAEEVLSEEASTMAAADKTETTVTGEYKQTEARKMLDLVNADRKNTNDSQALTWDYALEQYAMQRAAEIALEFSHTRPNGEPFSTGIMAYGYYSVGENIHKATGTNNHGAAKANQAWIDSTGHHINRTKAKWQGYAAACFYIANTPYGPMWCWVELFSTPNGNPNYVAPVNEKKDVTVVLNGDNYQINGIATDDGKNAYSKGWWYDEDKDKFTYIREVTYTSYVPQYIGVEGRIDGKYYTFDTEGFLTKESEKDLPFTREQFLGLVPSQPGQDPIMPPQGSNNGSTTNPNPVSVINNRYSRSEESQTRVTPGAIQDEYGYTLYVTPELINSGARWESQGSSRVFRLADGSVATGWLVHEGQRYYLDPNGAMATGWRRVNGSWYFFGPTDGTMKTGLFEYNGDRYYTDEKGAMQTGAVEVNGQRYIADLSGVLREA